MCIDCNCSGMLALRIISWQRKVDASLLHYCHEMRVPGMSGSSGVRLACSRPHSIPTHASHSGAFLFPLIDVATGTSSSSSSSTRTGTSTSTGFSSPVQDVRSVGSPSGGKPRCGVRTRFVAESNVNGIPVREMIFYPARIIQDVILSRLFPSFLYCPTKLEIVDGFGCGNLRYIVSVQVEGGQGR